MNPEQHYGCELTVESCINLVSQPLALDNEALINYVREASMQQNPFPSLVLIQTRAVPIISKRSPKSHSQPISPTNSKPNEGLIERARRRMYGLFVGERPPMELIADQLLDYFPNIETALSGKDDDRSMERPTSENGDDNEGDVFSEPSSPDAPHVKSMQQPFEASSRVHSVLSRSSVPTPNFASLSESPSRSVISSPSSVHQDIEPLKRWSFHGPSPAVSIHSENSSPTNEVPVRVVNVSMNTLEEGSLPEQRNAELPPLAPTVLTSIQLNQQFQNSDDSASVHTQQSFTPGATLRTRAHRSNTTALSHMYTSSKDTSDIDAVSYIRNLVKQSTELQTIHREATRRKSQAMFISRRNSQMPGGSLTNRSVGVQPTPGNPSSSNDLCASRPPIVSMTDAADAMSVGLYAQFSANALLSRPPSFPYRAESEAVSRIDVRGHRKTESVSKLNNRLSSLSYHEYEASSLEGSNTGTMPYASRSRLMSAEPEELVDFNTEQPASIASSSVLSGSEIKQSTEIRMPAAASIETKISVTSVDSKSHDSVSGLNIDVKAPFKWVKGKLIGEGSYGRVYHGLKLALPNPKSSTSKKTFIVFSSNSYP